MVAHRKPVALALAWIAGALSSACPALANDSGAGFAAGGLVLEATDAVRMISEDLRISADSVSVAYAFESVSGRDETLTMAFPLPEVDVGSVLHSTLRAARPDSANFVDFRVSVDGAPVSPTVTQAVLTPDGRDIAAELEALGVPALPFDDRLLNLLEGGETDPALLTALEQLGAMAEGMPTWRVQTTFFWQQTFPADRSVAVEHSYHPLAGTFLLYPTLDYRQDRHRWFRDTWCVGEDAWTAIAAMAEDAPGDELAVHQVDYILTTGANWAGPIGHFHLTVDTGAPDRLAALCWPGLQPGSAAAREFQADDWTPTADLSIVFVTAERD